MPPGVASIVFDRRQVVAGVIVFAVIVGWVVLTPGAAMSTLVATTSSSWFPLLLVGLYLLRPVVAWPITILSALVGFKYGFVVGLPIALLGAVFTSLPPYAVGRWLRGDDGWVHRVASGGETYFRTAGDLRGVVAARLAPTPAEAISTAAGIAHVPLMAFVVGTFIGEIPWTIAAVAIGASVQTTAAVDGVHIDPLLIVGGLLGAVLLLAGPLYRRLTTRTTPVDD